MHFQMLYFLSVLSNSLNNFTMVDLLSSIADNVINVMACYLYGNKLERPRLLIFHAQEIVKKKKKKYSYVLIDLLTRIHRMAVEKYQNSTFKGIDK